MTGYCAAMWHGNVELVREATAAFNRGGGDALTPYCDPEIEWHTTGRFVDEGVYRGHDGVRRMFQQLDDDLEGLQSRIDEVREINGQVVANTTFTGRGRRGAVPIELKLTLLIQFKDGKLAQVRQFLEAEEAVEAGTASE